MAQSKTFLIVDGSSLAHRAFYALPLLETKEGRFTNAIYGFINMLIKLLEKEKPDYAAIIFDLPLPTFRHRIYENYKGHRAKTPAELSQQIPKIKEIIQALNIAIFELEEFEADDLIGTLAHLAEEKGLRNLVVTGDTDILQLVSPKTTVLLTRRGITNLEIFNEITVKEKYGLKPIRLIDFKSLKGDPSDNVPGVPGIGEKTAKKLIQEYGSVENIINGSNLNVKNRYVNKIKKYSEQALLSKKLVTICRQVPVDFSLKECQVSPPRYDLLHTLFKKLEFKSLLQKIPHQATSKQFEDFAGKIKIIDLPDLESLRKKLKNIDSLALLIWTEPPSSWRGEIRGITIAVSLEESYFLPVDPKNEELLFLIYDILCPLLQDPNISKYIYDLKHVINLLRRNNINLRGNVFDIMLAAYLLEPTRSEYPIDLLAEDYLDIQIDSLKEVKNEDAYRLLGIYGCIAIRLMEVLSDQLKENNLWSLYQELELPLSFILAGMEWSGVKVDPDRLNHFSKEITNQMEKLEEEIFFLAGEHFNLNSPKQLSHILFEKLKLPVIRKTKTGFSTDARVLNELVAHHDIVAKILEYRQMAKLKYTYLEGLLPLIDSKSGKINTTFMQTTTATGRLSSKDPNLQNIPVKSEIGHRIREAFIPQNKDCRFLAADYSQIELRVLAHISQDTGLINAFINDEDIHKRTAAEIFNVNAEEVTSFMRNRAKAVNFGIVYGISDYGLAQDLGISRKEAQHYIDSYFERYPGVKEYMNKIVKQARQMGYVTTLMKRRRYLPEINHPNFGRRSMAERMARNTPIQGSAADIIKKAMVNIAQIIEQKNLKAKMILQVHDELIFEVPCNELCEVGIIIKHEMEQAFPLDIPLKVLLKTGKDWYHLHSFECYKKDEGRG